MLPAAGRTEGVPYRVRDINHEASDDGWGLSPVGTSLDGVAYFYADDAPSGFELWRSDGTAEGTGRIVDLFPAQDPLGDGPSGDSVPVRFGGEVFYAASDPAGGRELWATDGTIAGTRRVKDIAPGYLGYGAEQLTVVGSILFFTVGESPAYGPAQLWKSDGTEAGTELVTGTGFYRGPEILGAAGPTLFFRAAEAVHGDSLWATDGTESGTRWLRSIDWSQGELRTDVAVAGSTLFFTDYDGVHGDELWRSDGTSAGTVLVKDVYPGPIGSYIQIVVAAGDSVYFGADDGVHGTELWTSDGTEAGTVLVRDIRPGAESSSAAPGII